MKSNFVADGEWRLRLSEDFRAREKELHELICARYAEQCSSAGFWRGCLIRMKIFTEFRREVRRLRPSRQALYFWQP